MSADGQRTKWRRNIAENSNRLTRVHERYRQTTDGRTTTYSEREREFTFAKNQTNCLCVACGLTTIVLLVMWCDYYAGGKAAASGAKLQHRGSTEKMTYKQTANVSV